MATRIDHRFVAVPTYRYRRRLMLSSASYTLWRSPWLWLPWSEPWLRPGAVELPS